MSSRMEDDLKPFVRLALDCVGREFPNQVALHLDSAFDLQLPKEATPAFFGCYDWHSAVHSHWLLARALHVGGAGRLAPDARRALETNLTAENLRAEVEFLEPRPGFERPYGLAWLLQLTTELREWADPLGDRLASNLAPLAALARKRFVDWLPKLTHPVRTGVHSQTAFAMGLVLDHACSCGHEDLRDLVVHRCHVYHGADHDYPLHLEPSGEDFLSPALSAADLMRRVLEPGPFSLWLRRVLPGLTDRGEELPLSPVKPLDRTDGRLTHLDGLNLSRAFMLQGIASALLPDDSRREVLRRTVIAHREAGLAAVESDRYEGAHWLGSFAVYLLTDRGRCDGGTESGPLLPG